MFLSKRIVVSRTKPEFPKLGKVPIQVLFPKMIALLNKNAVVSSTGASVKNLLTDTVYLSLKLYYDDLVNFLAQFFLIEQYPPFSFN